MCEHTWGIIRSGDNGEPGIWQPEGSVCLLRGGEMLLLPNCRAWFFIPALFEDVAGVDMTTHVSKGLIAAGEWTLGTRLGRFGCVYMYEHK